MQKPGGSNSVVESQPSKLLVAGSIPVSRSIVYGGSAVVCEGSAASRFALAKPSRATAFRFRSPGVKPIGLTAVVYFDRGRD